MCGSGGLGLTGGIADVGNLFDALMGIHKNLADDTILDKYSEVRMRIWAETTDPMSRENFRRLHGQDPDKARENDEFFQLCVKAETDSELARELALVCLLLVPRWGLLHNANATAGTGCASPRYDTVLCQNG